jgi:hypothetical protein
MASGSQTVRLRRARAARSVETGFAPGHGGFTAAHAGPDRRLVERAGKVRLGGITRAGDEALRAARRFRRASSDRGRRRLLSRGYRWFESISLQQRVSLSPASAFEVENPGFPRGRARPAWRLGRQRRARNFDIGPAGGNISAGPYSSTQCRWWGRREIHAGPNDVGPSGLKCGRSLSSDRAQTKPSTIR